MKLRITISGPKVHDVGYRYFLLNTAMSNRIRMFEAHNLEGDAGEEVLAFVDGKEKEVKSFQTLVETKRPVNSIVSKILVEYFEGDVMSIGEYAQFCTTIQMNKAIPLLIGMNEKMDIMIEKQDIMIEKQDIMIEKQDIMIEKQDMMNEKMDRMNEKQDKTTSILDVLVEKQDETISEIRSLREDMALRDNVEWQVRVERDIRIIKSKLGIR